MSARDDILIAVRAARDTAPAMPHAHTYLRTSSLGQTEKIALFASRLTDYHVTVLRVLSPASIADLVGKQIAARRLTSLVVPNDMPAAWLPLGFPIHAEAGLTQEDMNRASGVVTGCLLGIAETGTIVLDTGRAQGSRALTLLPDYHLCVVFESQVVGMVPEAVEAIRPSVLAGAPITFFSGPSATADIELDRVEGVHGPRTLDVILVAGKPTMKRVLRTLMLLALARCSPVDGLNAITPDGGLTITKNVAYAPGDRHRLDIYQPQGATGLPVIVFFYGGSWREGSKSIYPFVAATLARRGNIVVVPDYRLYPDVQFPAFLHDCAQAVGWTEKHVAELGGDPHRVFLMGHSAGAYNAVMLGVDPHYLAAAGVDRASLAGIVALAGPYDFLPITGADIKPVFAPVQDGPASQPITYVDGHNPPLLLLAGTSDGIVKPRNTTAMAAKVRAAGGPVQEKLYPGLGHIGLILAVAPSFQWRAPVLKDVLAFLAATGRASGQQPASVPHAATRTTMGQSPG